MPASLPEGFELEAPEQSVQGGGLPEGFELEEQHAQPPQAPKFGAIDVVASPETVLALTSGTVAQPISGIATLGALGTNALGLTDIDIRGLTERVQRALTYEPRGRIAKTAVAAAQYPFDMLGKGAEYVGKKTTNKLVDLGASPEVAGTTGAVTQSAINLLPALLLRKVGKGTPAQQAATAAETESVARNVATRAGTDFDSLGAKTQETLKTIASDADAAAALDPATVARQARFEELGYTDEAAPTSNQLTQNRAGLANERNATNTNAGKPIEDRYVAQNRRTLENIRTLKGERASPGEVETGRSTQGALRQKLAAKEAEVDAKYEAARAAGELQGKVSPRAVVELVRTAADKTDLAWVESWLGKNKVVSEGGAVNKLSLETLEGLRKAAVQRVKNGGTDGFYARKVIRAVDKATDGAGGSAYKAARAARTEQGLEFGDQQAIARLVEDKTRTDRTVALEDTWNDVVLRGSIDDLVKVKRSLLTGADKAAKASGRKAWRDIQAETIAFIEREATKGVSQFRDGTPNVTPAALKRAIDKIGTEKLDQVFGSGTRRRLDQIAQANKDLKAEPAVISPGSPTFRYVLSFLEKAAGNTVTGAVRAASEIGKAGRQTRESLRNPLEEKAQQVTSRNKLRQLAPLTVVQPNQ